MIYFARIGPEGPVKIGHTANVEARLKTLGSSYGATLTLLKAIPGDEWDEAEFHARFDDYRLGKTEQFRPGPDLMDFVGHPRTRDWKSVRKVKASLPTNVRLTPPELGRVERLKSQYGLRTTSDVIRFALAWAEDHTEEMDESPESGQ